MHHVCMYVHVSMHVCMLEGPTKNLTSLGSNEMGDSPPTKTWTLILLRIHENSRYGTSRPSDQVSPKKTKESSRDLRYRGMHESSPKC